MNGRTLVFLGAAGLILGALLPWATFTSIFTGTVGLSGLRGDGIITGGIGAILLLVVLGSKGKAGRSYSATSGLLAMLALLLAGWKVCSLTGLNAESDSAIIGIGSGVWVSVVSAMVALAGGFTKLPKEHDPLMPQVSDAMGINPPAAK